MIKQKLNKEHNVSVTTKNFGKTGDRSDQIEKRVETSKNIQDFLKDADVITMTVGGNDLMIRTRKQLYGTCCKQA